ncbi:EAL domain-containing protein [Endozoicomonas sp. SM1973]|uniref:EAL domain-containing protein n=1 Tax=Spartinivicinus marinus TaxID=2994442 RepID=A0A853HXG2_9GAMM|nr:GGDEF domain-containing phosphodiesterase [Spartinivicinus marinus]MCX4027384.1 EAL domain-containing protein [Spartinivicinus marinus]NYZ66440.1 EAL domain-containing protein [Spartinivicinus marinus]
MWRVVRQLRRRKVKILLVGEQPDLFRHLVSLLPSWQYNEPRWQWSHCQSIDELPRSLNYLEPDLVLISYENYERVVAELNDSHPPIILLCEEATCYQLKQSAKIPPVDFIPYSRLSDDEFIRRTLRYNLEQTKSKRDIKGLTCYDRLTGIANRAWFQETLAEELTLLTNSSLLGVLLIDLDGFSKVNQALGHQAGDSLIWQVAERLKQVYSDSGSYIARVNGDEFGLIIPDVNHQAQLILQTKQTLQALADPFFVAGHQVLIGCSIGLACCPMAGSTIDEVLTHAHVALSKAKKQLGNHYVIYEPGLKVDVSDGLLMEAELRQALRRNELQLLYQPRVDSQTNRVSSVEGLLRWHHPQRGLLMPADFIPLAERTNLIVPIGYWVINQACHDIDLLGKWGIGDLHVAINLSFQQFKDAKLLATVSHIIKKHQVRPHLLEFELTETAMLQEQADVAAKMKALQQLGINFALDDFGTGFSSFSHIQGLPINTIKIDRSFVKNMLINRGDQVIVGAIIELAHNLSLTVVAEGVETCAQAEWLKMAGCDEMQGFLLSQPLNVEELCQRLVEEQAVRAY